VDFFSIGTNDLTQYTLAVDRDNEKCREYYNPLHPAVLRLIKRVIDVGNTFGKKLPCAVSLQVMIKPQKYFLALVYKCLAMTPSSIPRVKKVVLSTNMKKLRQLQKRRPL